MQDFRNLKVWERAHALVIAVYASTNGFPRSEMFGLTSQVRRSSASIAANIAEGCGRTQREFSRFLQIALGSASESEYHLLLARDLKMLAPEEHKKLNAEVVAVKRMLSALLSKLKADG